MKQIHQKGSLMTITPYKNNQTWTVETQIKRDGNMCTATVDFNVPGKPNPPPIALTATYLTNIHGERTFQGVEVRTRWEFTVPTANLPLNSWVDIKAELVPFSENLCTNFLPQVLPWKGVFADLHVGDLK